jgi:hypothetical protein
MNNIDLENEAKRLNDLLKGKVIIECYRHREGELVLILSDDTKLFINSDTSLEFSVT